MDFYNLPNRVTMNWSSKAVRVYTPRKTHYFTFREYGSPIGAVKAAVKFEKLLSPAIGKSSHRETATKYSQTGIVGVSPSSSKGVVYGYVANWNECRGGGEKVRCGKYFSLKKLGKDAFDMAAEYREKMIKLHGINPCNMVD